MGRALILAPCDIATGSAAGIGGKAGGLLAIERAGLPVPPWRVLPADIAVSRPWRGDTDFLDALRSVLAELGGEVAVRSSGENEDAAEASQAGQFHTGFAATFDDVIAELDRVVDSARGAGMAIVVQRALAPEFAGVAFSADPASARTDELYVESVAGHGRTLVDGSATPQRTWLTLGGACLRGEPDAHVPMDALAAGLLALEKAVGAAVDVEWAVSGGVLYFLQARALTALADDPARRPEACHTSWFFDQRFLRPITPLTRTTLIPVILRASLGEALAMRGRQTGEIAVHYHGGQAYVAHAVYRAMLDGAPRWFLSPDLRQLYPARCACKGTQRTATIFGYAWDALCSVIRHRYDVFGNVRAWERFRDTLPGQIEAACAPPGTFEEQWRALDALTVEFLRIHRWSILWADYFFRGYLLFARVVGAHRADRWLRAGMRLATAEANRAAAAGRAVASGFGDRSASLDYAEPTWKEIYGDQPEMPETLDNLESPRKTLGCLILAPVRRLLELREEQRLHWEHILARQRAIAITHTERRQVRVEDVWLLTWEELTGAGPLPGDDVLVERRHALLVEALIPKPLFLGPSAPPLASRTSLRGMGVSAGRARGTVVHLRNPAAPAPEHLPSPCILVVPALDPAHTALLQRTAGIVAERGGMLSHAAILAREYGVPMVSAFEGAFSLLPAGAEAELDGQTGEIRLI